MNCTSYLDKQEHQKTRSPPKRKELGSFSRTAKPGLIKSFNIDFITNRSGPNRLERLYRNKRILVKSHESIKSTGASTFEEDSELQPKFAREMLEKISESVEDKDSDAKVQLKPSCDHSGGVDSLMKNRAEIIDGLQDVSSMSDVFEFKDELEKLFLS